MFTVVGRLTQSSKTASTGLHSTSVHNRPRGNSSAIHNERIGYSAANRYIAPGYAHDAAGSSGGACGNIVEKARFSALGAL